ncbi:MAG: hypothetical protein J1F23_08755 [Oscillospiraceae bacterium]|nr:hypothetical protein [Oscillospiraceae bacterium]
MRRFYNAQGFIAILRELKSGKYRLRISDSKGQTICSKLLSCESDAGAELNMYGDYWTERAV